MARVPQQQTEQAPVERTLSAEGVPLPTTIAPASPEAVAAQTRPPTVQEIRAEWGTYKAIAPLMVAGKLAVPAGQPVPVSHPMLRDSDEVDEATGQGGWGPGWVSTGAVALQDGFEAPEDLRAAHEAYEASRRAMYPGAHPGA